MSMIQMAQYLRECPRPQATPCQEAQSIYYFLYDNYYSACRFRQIFKECKPIGIAWLPGWTWHLNNDGKANIRKAFYDRYDSFADQAIPAPATELSTDSSTSNKVFGFVFEISAQDDARLHNMFSTSRIRIAQNINVVTSKPGFAIWGQRLTVMTYFDARNTSDALVNVWEDEEQKRNWMKGFTEMLFSGCPKDYVQDIYQQLNGRFRNVEPLHCRDLLIRPAVMPAPARRVQTARPPQLMGASGSGRSQNQGQVVRKRKVGDSEERVVKRARVPGPYPSPLSSDPVACRG